MWGNVTNGSTVGNRSGVGVGVGIVATPWAGDGVVAAAEEGLGVDIAAMRVSSDSTFDASWLSSLTISSIRSSVQGVGESKPVSVGGRLGAAVDCGDTVWPQATPTRNNVNAAESRSANVRLGFN